MLVRRATASVLCRTQVVLVYLHTAQGSARRRNQMFLFFCRSVKGSRIYEGSNFAIIIHWLKLSPLIQYMSGPNTLPCINCNAT